jgi:flagellar protein FliO/FliZ
MKPLTYTRGARLVRACTLLSTLTLVMGVPASAVAAAAKKCAYDGCQHLNLTSGDANAATSSGSAGGSIVRTIVGLAIVIAVIYGLTWVIRQTKGVKSPASGYGLEQLASLPMGTNRSVALVRVGAELHLLGISEHGVTGIRVYSEEEAYELGLPLEAPDDGPDVNGGPPVDRLMRFVKRFTVR